MCFRFPELNSYGELGPATGTARRYVTRGVLACSLGLPSSSGHRALSPHNATAAVAAGTTTTTTYHRNWLHLPFKEVDQTTPYPAIVAAGVATALSHHHHKYNSLAKPIV